jgi:hypothetical protein
VVASNVAGKQLVLSVTRITGWPTGLLRVPQEMMVGEMTKVLHSVRGLQVADGFAGLLHPFIEVPPGTTVQRAESEHVIQ